MTHPTYHIQGMDCADCVVKIEKGLRQIEGVETVQVDLATGLLHVSGPAKLETIRGRVEMLGYRLVTETTRQPNVSRKTGLMGFVRFLLSRTDTRLALAGGALLIVSAVAAAAGAPLIWMQFLQIAALLVAGYPIARGALVNLWINHDFSINLLMTIAAIGAMVIGETAESATLIFLFALSEALEGYTADRARSVLGEVRDLAPLQAVRLVNGADEIVQVSELRLGDMIVVNAGERIPMDGLINTGQSAVNQAPITGESMPVSKMPGDTVFAGTINGSGVLTIQVTHLSKDTTIQRIIEMIEQAQSVRAPTQRFIDRFAQVYTPIMVVLAVLVAAVPPLVFGQPFLNPPGQTGWLYRSLALLVIACPCALVISAPVTVVSAITNAARSGVLIKGGAFLEALAGIKVFAFDKTGTLTQGRPVVTTFRAVECPQNSVASPMTGTAGCGDNNCSDCTDVLALASALERRSAHPLARSVVEAAAAIGLDHRYAPAADATAIAGSGLQGHVNGKLATIGSHSLFEREHPHQNELCSWVQTAENQGQTTMLVCDGDRVRGFIAVADSLRDDSSAVIKQLKALRKQTVMLTGDNAPAARAVGSRLGIDQVRANLLPEDKVGAIQDLNRQYGQVAMVGDGINDAPALVTAAVGIAMGGAGSAQAMETADIVLMGGDLRHLPFAVRLSTFARQLIRQNVIISLVTKLVFILLALSGMATLWMAVLADVGVSLLVTTNGMRANRMK